ncbi:hypothetical protein [Kutzneria sp. CA-103260]|uniref:hypothetical protein n=1 Tax=Kutzneria sp. CA-103260 TaxID=2802641 RepID=UPI001BA4DDC4|nr:hypothetical protein [Kutzneria sp. CA-103260]QUQ63522.1 hypothetical protein JJ691_12350 [Kutzneria sp. CA-103260]
MSPQTTALGRFVTGFNGVVLALRSSRLLGPLVRRHVTIASYTGRRSGRTFSTPVGYKLSGDVATITVMLADAKKWWRNFTGDGGALTLELDGRERTGHAVAERMSGNRVRVTVQF